MRIAYLDEAGVGKIEQEPFTVVAGVVISSDLQWRITQRRLQDLVNRHIPEPEIKGFAFHATDLFHGTKATHRSKFSKEIRWEILDELCGMPKQLGLPVVFGAVNRRGFAKDFPGLTAHEIAVHAQTTASMLCLCRVDSSVASSPGSDGDAICTLVYENNDHCKRLVNVVQKAMQRPFPAGQRFVQKSKHFFNWPLKHVVDGAHFAEKSDAPILQLADACAFAIKRQMNNAKHSARFFEPLRTQINDEPLTWA
jgi:hypothetical protein